MRSGQTKTIPTGRRRRPAATSHGAAGPGPLVCPHCIEVYPRKTPLTAPAHIFLRPGERLGQQDSHRNLGHEQWRQPGQPAATARSSARQRWSRAMSELDRLRAQAAGVDRRWLSPRWQPAGQRASRYVEAVGRRHPRMPALLHSFGFDVCHEQIGGFGSVISRRCDQAVKMPRRRPAGRASGAVPTGLQCEWMLTDAR